MFTHAHKKTKEQKVEEGLLFILIETPFFNLAWSVAYVSGLGFLFQTMLVFLIFCVLFVRLKRGSHSPMTQLYLTRPTRHRYRSKPDQRSVGLGSAPNKSNLSPDLNPTPGQPYVTHTHKRTKRLASCYPILCPMQYLICAMWVSSWASNDLCLEAFYLRFYGNFSK